MMRAGLYLPFFSYGRKGLWYERTGRSTYNLQVALKRIVPVCETNLNVVFFSETQTAKRFFFTFATMLHFRIF